MPSHRAYQLYVHITWHTWKRTGCLDQAAVADLKSAVASATRRLRVRVLRGPQRGAVGLVAALPELPQPIETGAKVHCAEVDLGGDDGHLLVPLANLEIFR